MSDRSRPLVSGVLPMVLAALFFGAMAVTVKRVTGRLPGPEVAFCRFVFGVLACALVMTRIRLRPHNLTGLFLRGLFGGSAVLLYFLSLQHLPVGVATLLNYTAPVFTALWAALWLGEAVTPRMVAALALTLVGVALVIEGNAAPGSLGLTLWPLVGLASAVLSGAAVATIRAVRKTDGSWEIFAAFSIMGALITGIPSAQQWVSPRAAEWALLFWVGLLSLAGQLLMTYAFRYVRAAVGGILIQLTPVVAIALGFWINGERVAVLVLLGAAVTLAGVSWGAWIAAAPAPDQ